jgi:hypothetical protein
VLAVHGINSPVQASSGGSGTRYAREMEDKSSKILNVNNMRDKTHWCLDKKHELCGGRVQYIKGLADNFDLSDDKFEGQKCLCKCHKD